ncbi:MAG: T9SS type A sorting domain-containing protein [Melioribacteraceae bacterium]|nr:T9SS type A sorting domain-containing protein [Melioribacteraceae bacterium]
MKRLLLTVIFITSLNLCAQVILYTPNGQSIQTIDKGWAPYDAAYYATYSSKNFGSGKLYPNSCVEESCDWENGIWEYNCHTFVWNNWQGVERWNSVDDIWKLGKPSPYSLMWVDYPGVWCDDTLNPIGIKSYVNANSSSASIVTYKRDSEITHSARPIGDGTRYLSKWGSNPIINHPGDEVPLIYGAINKRYKINTAYRPVGNGDPAGRNWQTISDALNGIPTDGSLVSVLSGTHSVSNNISIPVGVTLTLAPGTNIIFQNGSTLVINGSLEINGSSGNEVIFDFVSPNSSTQNGIIVNNGANVSLNFAEIKNAYNGIKVEQEIVGISNSKIHDCYNGIFLNNTNSAGGEVEIGGNQIYNNTHSGIICYNSGGFYTGNEIYGCGIGVALADFSSPIFGEPLIRGYNNLYNNGVGIYPMNNSNPIVGNNMHGGYNKISSINYEVHAINNCTVEAEHNYWGSNPPPNSFYASASTIDYDPWLTSPPFSALMKGNNSESKIENISELTDDSYDKKTIEKLLNARNNFYLGKYDEAQTEAENVLETKSESREAELALDILEQISRKRSDFSLISNYSQKSTKSKITGLASLLEVMNTSKDKISDFDALLKEYEDNSEIVKRTLFSKFIFYFAEKNDRKNAEHIGDTILKNYPDSEESKRVKIHLLEVGEIIIEEKELYKNETDTEEKFAVTAYPNPFNPVTNIQFKITDAKHVKIKVYNQLGQLVEELTNKVYTEGTHKVVFNAKNLASGVYYYTIEAEAEMRTNKILLIK